MKTIYATSCTHGARAGSVRSADGNPDLKPGVTVTLTGRPGADAGASLVLEGV
ncbi:hypothetical protein CLV77_1865 [Brevirhabdus pacifica]|uniref:hypothetical protein n=1 Tax=Brevirhabdus pacifica TaxID=1267768 RepID=UPI000CCB89EE|nr:hypothetical protein [Brevirhabdus pacifica]PJJ87297.1 hypothetical protein CLV77_1865 [Brevirhabdus pacifica]